MTEQPQPGSISTGDVTGIGIAIGPGARAEVHYYPIELRAPLREVFDPLIEDRTALFGGRTEVFDHIASAIRKGSGGYLVVTAPAGFGKTALMATLVSRHRDAFAYHFFTSLYGAEGVSEDFFLRNVVEQMAAWHGREEVLPDERTKLRALYHELLDEPLEYTQILVLDGLDEVTWDLRPYLARRLPSALDVIATVRDVGQDWLKQYGFPRDQTQSLALAGLSRAEVADVLRAAGGKASSLADDPQALDELLRVAAYEPNRALGADTFYVRLLAEDAAAGLVTAESIGQQPAGLEAYLDRWWKEIRAAAGDAPTRDLFGTLAVALGPIARTDLEHINSSLSDEWASDFFDEVLERVRRFVVGDDGRGYTLVHPRLRQYLHGRIKTGEYEAKLLRYCADWAAHGSAYALTWYARHLADAIRLRPSPEREQELLGDLYSLISAEFMRAKLERTRSHRAFADDVEQVLEIASAEQPPNLTELVRGCLVDATLDSLTANVPPGVLRPVAESGSVDKACDFAALMKDSRRRAEAYREIAVALLSQRETARAKELLERALAAAQGIPDAQQRSRTTSQLAVVFVHANARERAAEAVATARELALAVPDDSGQTYALAELADALAEIGDTRGADDALGGVAENARSWQLGHFGVPMTGANPQLLARAGSIAAKIGQRKRAAGLAEEAAGAMDVWSRVTTTEATVLAYCDVTTLFAELGEAARAEEAADDALSAIERAQSKPDKAWLQGIVAHALARSGDKERAKDVAEHALAAAEDLDDTSQRTWVRGQAAIALMAAGERERAERLADDVLDRAVEVGGHKPKVGALVAIARAMAGEPAAEDRASEVAGRALALAEAIPEQELTRFWSTLGGALPTEALVEKALAVPGALQRQETKAWMLYGVFRGLVRRGESRRAGPAVEAASTAAEGIEAASVRAAVLTNLGIAATEAGQKERTAQLFERAERAAGQIQEAPARVEALATLAEYLAKHAEIAWAVRVAEDAKRAADGIEDERLREQIQVAVVWGLANVGEHEQALTVARGIRQWHPEVLATRSAVIGIAQAGDPEEAARLMRTSSLGYFENWPERDQVLAEIVLAFARRPDVDSALKTSSEISKPESRAKALSDAAAELAGAGAVDGALRLIDAIEDQQWKDLAQVGVLSPLVRDGDPQPAVVRAEEIESPLWKAVGFARIAAGVLEAGDLGQATACADRALVLARAIDDVQLRADALCRLLDAIPTELTRDRADDLLRLVLMTARDAGRDYVFGALTMGAPLLASLDRGEKLWRAYRAVVDVEAWWLV